MLLNNADTQYKVKVFEKKKRKKQCQFGIPTQYKKRVAH